ncbi:hypothetical protein R1sor_012518 [Riccia sorocarpa]|uniref:GPI mannosyltransferase 2 n=1 Tax=Riccia sorocarpa TaxID=122646 RepID=A0ABD3I809_9MARC
MAIGGILKSKYRRTVITVAVQSRLLVTALFVLWRVLASPYDTSAELNQPCLSQKIPDWTYQEDEGVRANRSSLGLLGQAIEKTIVWDGVYYVKIAECGYEYEHYHAFLPIFPLAMRFVTRTFLSKLVPSLGLRATLALSGYLINNLAFVFSAFCLFMLTEALLEDGLLALTAAALFCFNPASTFYSAIYSESLFALLSFTGILCFLKGRKWWAVILFGLSSGVRSNGVLHAGLFLYQAMHKVFNQTIYRRRFSQVVPTILTAVLQSFAVATPFVGFQFYGWLQMCYIPRVKLISPARPWCSASVPYLYGFVQSHYWNVGFLRYFQLKQLPNFLLASPMLVLSICSIIAYGRQQPRLLFSLGLVVAGSSSPAQAKVALLSDGEEVRAKIARKGKTGDGSLEAPRKGFFSPAAVCFLIQLGFMTAVAMFVMHVQVATRFLSVSPPVYWYGAHTMISSKVRGRIGKLIWSSFLAYVKNPYQLLNALEKRIYNALWRERERGRNGVSDYGVLKATLRPAAGSGTVERGSEHPRKGGHEGSTLKVLKFLS